MNESKVQATPRLQLHHSGLMEPLPCQRRIRILYIFCHTSIWRTSPEERFNRRYEAQFNHI
ncbi:hypothetical protein C0J52_17864 [Blattella germanica]|nr:hypothetical protein C0J52_17864 [Blattella germanica]